VRADAEEPLAYRFKSGHLLDVVWVEVLELQPVCEQHPTDEPADGDGEAALVEDHERHHVPAGRAWNRLVGGYDLFDGLGEGRQLACLDKTKELLAGDVGARPVRYCDSEVLGELEVREATALWIRKNSELKGRARERRSG
jgi:hypothetical protein